MAGKLMFNIRFDKTMRDVQWSFISLAVSSIAHLLLRITLGKELGPSGLGLYTLIFTIYMFGIQFAAFGIETALTKYIAEYKEDSLKINKYISSGLFASFFSGLIFGFSIYILSTTISINLFHNSNMIPLLQITAICFPFIAIQKAVQGVLNGFRSMKYFAYLNVCQNTLIVVSSVFLVLSLKMGVEGAIVGLVIPTIVMGILSLYYVKGNFVFHLGLLKGVFKDLSSFGFYVVLANSLGVINTQIDSLMIGYFMSETDVGYYAIAAIFMQGVILIPSAVQRITTPAIATYYGKKDYYSIEKTIKSTMLKTFELTLLISFCIAIFGKFIIIFLFKDFLPAYTPMLILLTGYTVYSVLISVGGALSSVGAVKITFKISLICTFINALLNVLLIPQYGLIGASIATSISLIVTSAFQLYFIKRYVLKNKSWKVSHKDSSFTTPYS
ncbi:MAG TPA: flippase, partial [Methanosarcina sp.]|nr:flippase [Methanosarcina sp.]